MLIDLTKLQNGSDIRGIAVSGVPGEAVNLTTDIAERIGKAFLVWLSSMLSKKKEELTIGVGTDSRISAGELKQAFIRGVNELGGNILDAGMATTPAMFMSTQFSETHCDGAVMLTASHLPFNRNGFKFFTGNSGLEKQNISEILNIAGQDQWNPARLVGEYKQVDLISLYSEFLCRRIRESTAEHKPLKGKKILVDAGNGAGGFFAEKVLEALGADTRGSLFLDPDGTFPNHIPNPEDQEAMAAITQAVLKEKADLGIIFDTDVDRSAIVDEHGNPINRNRLIALLSAIVLKEHPGSYIVTDSVTSDGLKVFIEKHGGIHFRYQRGYKNVINKSIELNAAGKESWLAIETSGHGALKENFFLDDGAYLTAYVLIEFARLIKIGRSLGSLIAELKEPVESKEYRLELISKNFKLDGEELIDRMREFVKDQTGWRIEPENYEGVRVGCDKQHGDGWFLLRLSLHDPVMPLNLESDSIGGINFIVSKLQGFLKSFAFIKTESLTFVP